MAVADKTIEYTRQRDWFDPDKTQASVTVVGCGGIGSFAAFALAKLGVQTIRLVDFDTVEEHNIPNQMFTPIQAGDLKTRALANTIASFDPSANMAFEIETYEQRLQDGVPLSDVVVSALDSMEARADLWEQVRMKINVKLFLDARLAAENIVLYAVNPINAEDIAGYEATLHSDEEALELSCTGRSIIDVGFAVASLITRAVRRQYAHEEHERVVYLNQQTLDLFKGGWA